ncbi:MAG: hydantoinase B/oxoprolinase family protein, partial [Phycisphaerales bacterium]
YRPGQPPLTHKVLSSGRVKGAVGPGSTVDAIVDPRRQHDLKGFWDGYTLSLCALRSENPHIATVRQFDAATGRLRFSPPLPEAPTLNTAYELYSDEPSPLLAIRYLLGLQLADPIGNVDVRLGSTRATNALLERKGGPAALVTTAGFGDILVIANQNRPKLFELNIRKPEQLATRIVELDERVSADGSILRPIDPDEVRSKLARLRREGPCALAICLLHAYANPAHEQTVARIARELGFEHVSVSSQVSPLQQIVSRGDTTVVDAYLAPVIQDYVRSIHSRMPTGRLRMMTSAGGLTDAAQAVAKDTLLSGPAGGVVGFARIGRQAGFDKCIGFDMGGTSTDVSRYDGQFEYQFETTKGGVRVVAPMLAVETVAAGGGSICDFDGQKLVVGPHSAGAAPGPACYGSGGPLTVTDVNLHLGKIIPHHFPFALDRAAVEDRLAQTADRIARETSTTLSPVALADGFTCIANENMAGAIRRISLARGYDPAAYTLVTFGGAGAQHACAVADLLGIRRVLLTPLAGVLSAYGISVADVKRFAERMVQKPCTADTLADLEPVFADMEARLRRDILDQGVAPGDVCSPTRMLDLRYDGEDSAITVAAGDGDYADRFERMHEQLYGYRHTGRAIEVVAARLELVGLAPKPPSRRETIREREPSANEYTTVFFDRRPHRTPVHHRASLRVGDRFAGPAVVIEDTSTIVIEPGWSAQVIATGDILLMRQRKTSPKPQASTEADPVQLELFNNRFVAIAEQMGTTLTRTALSTNVKQRQDFSCAIFTAGGDLVVNAPHQPVHLGSMSNCVKAVLADVPDLAPGDVVVNNDPFRGGTHVPDVTCVTPLFDSDDGSPLFFVASRAHHAEIGGTRPGSMPADSTCLAQEGALIRHVKVVQAGRMQTEALRERLTAGPYPSRSPDENIADICAQIAANQTGIHGLNALLNTHTKPVVLAFTEHIRRAAEVKMTKALKRIPGGTYTFRDGLDDGAVIAVSITIRDGTALIDFTGSSGVHPGNLNANPAVVSSAVLYCFRCLIDEDIPLNAGVLAPLRIVVPPGLLNPPARDDPARCAAVAAGNVETSQRLVDVIFGALGTAAASQGTMNNLIFGNDRFGYYETICGGAGAGPDFDGADAVHTHMTNTRQTDPEVIETRYPVRMNRLQIRQGSGGVGRRRGGNGVVREFEFLDDLTVCIISQRRLTRPYGLQGGEPGTPGQNRLRRRGRTLTETLGPIAQCDVHPHDVLTIETPGGGGYGPPP